MLEGADVVLTEVRRDDCEAMYSWINDAQTVRFNAPYVPVEWSSHAAWFDGIGRDPTRIFLAVRRESTSPIIGVIQLKDIHHVHRSAELTMRIGSEADRGKGLGSEALKLALRFAFDDLNLQRVWLRVFSTNERAIRAYKRAGFELEGTMRRSAYMQGVWKDEMVLAALRPSP